MSHPDIPEKKSEWTVGPGEGLRAPIPKATEPVIVVSLPNDIFECIEIGWHEKHPQNGHPHGSGYRAVSRKLRFWLAQLQQFAAEPGVQPLIDEIEEILRP